MKNIDLPIKKDIHINQINSDNYKKLKNICKERGITINSLLRYFIDCVADKKIIPVIISGKKKSVKNKIVDFVILDNSKDLPF